MILLAEPPCLWTIYRTLGLGLGLGIGLGIGLGLGLGLYPLFATYGLIGRRGGIQSRKGETILNDPYIYIKKVRNDSSD